MLTLIAVAVLAQAEAKTVTEDRAWQQQAAALSGSLEAEWIIRVGDVDNLNFGWPEGFDPFCGRMSQSHEWPTNQSGPGDVAGTDRVVLSSKLKPSAPKGCGADGYSGTWDPKRSKPVPFKLPLSALKGVTVKNAFVQLFIDDFQAPSLCSRFRVELNGKRFVELEKILNAIEQTGPVGKLITVPIPEEFHADLTNKPELVIAIDEALGVPDGWAIDFVRLLVNRKRENTCKGTIRGLVVIKGSDTPVPNARVTLADGTSIASDAEGRFTITNVPTGFEVVTASASGYSDGASGADVGQGEDNPEVRIELEPGKQLVFDQKKIAVGEALTLANILFDVSKAELKKESKPELEKVVQFLKDNPAAEIELAGHTSSEGDAAVNRSLSYRRVKACKDYITGKGIDPGRIVAVGYGPDRPVAPNDTEPNRKLNRRVELRIVKAN